MGRRNRRRAGFAAALAMCLLAAFPGAALGAPDDGSHDGLPTYKTADGAKAVTGAKSIAEARNLAPGIYTDTIGPGDTLFYGVALDARSSAFVSAVAVPEPGSSVDYGDGISVTLQSRNGIRCDSGTATFGVSRQARPIADYAARVVRPRANCRQAGQYYVRVERKSDVTSDSRRWRIELRYMSEPAVLDGSPAPPVPGWDSASPTPPGGEGQPRRGGTGFNDARALKAGAWRDRLRPGETRYYQVLLDWGQQLTVTGELAEAAKAVGSRGFALNGLGLELYNTARGLVDARSLGYDGRRKAVSLGPTAPVAYNNRFSGTAKISGMRFSGWYYLAVSLHPDVAKFTTGTVPLTLRLNVTGKREPGPHYDGDAAAAGFGVTEGDREAARKGQTAADSAHSGALRLVAAVAFGAGAVLLLGLGAWTLFARRRAAPAGAAVPHPSWQPARDGQPSYGRPSYGGESSYGGDSLSGGEPSGEWQPGQDPRHGPPTGW